MQPLTSVVVPAFNEADALLSRLTTLTAYLDRRFDDDYELLVIDDGSTDGTGAQLASARNRFERLYVETHEQNYGLNAAIRTGIALARGERIVVLDADLTYAPQIAGSLVDALDRGAQIAVASAYMRGGGSRSVPLFRLLLSRWANRYLSLAVHGKINTLTCMVRAYDRRLASRFLSESAFDECTFGVLLHAYRCDVRIEEVPAVLDWSAQPRSRSVRLRPMKLLSHAWSVLVAGVRARPLLLAGIPGLVPGLLPLVAAIALLLHASPVTIAKATAVTLAVQCASLSIFSFQLGSFLRRKHVDRTRVTSDAS